MARTEGFKEFRRSATPPMKPLTLKLASRSPTPPPKTSAPPINFAASKDEHGSTPAQNTGEAELLRHLEGYRIHYEETGRGDKGSWKQQEVQAQIKEEAEEALQSLEDMRRAQEEAKQEIAIAKSEAERAARERIEAERKEEEERQKAHVDAMKRAEENARMRFEAEMKATEESRKDEDEALAALRAENDARLRKAEEELREAKRELEEIRQHKARHEEEERIKKELELKRLREEEKEAAARASREQEAREAVERYKQQERERIAEEARKHEAEEEYKRRLKEDLINSGVDEEAIKKIMNKERIIPSEQHEPKEEPTNRPIYTRMARRHLSIETLRAHKIDFDYDQVSYSCSHPSEKRIPHANRIAKLTLRLFQDPDYLLIRRWVPEWEQDQLWKHTRLLRQERGSNLQHQGSQKPEVEFEWVRKKKRNRKKSPGLLMYLAGARISESVESTEQTEPTEPTESTEATDELPLINSDPGLEHAPDNMRIDGPS